jgi:hypothetical protein
MIQRYIMSGGLPGGELDTYLNLSLVLQNLQATRVNSTSSNMPPNDALTHNHLFAMKYVYIHHPSLHFNITIKSTSMTISTMMVVMPQFSFALLPTPFNLLCAPSSLP